MHIQFENINTSVNQGSQFIYYTFANSPFVNTNEC